MKAWLTLASENAIIVIDILALIVVVVGSIEAFIAVVKAMFSRPTGHDRRETGLRFARWLVVGLTFQLAADIIETSISTSWVALGRIGAIAVIRTFLNYFLERDIAEVRATHEGGAPQMSRRIERLRR